MAKNNDSSNHGIFEMESGLVHFVPKELALQKDIPFPTSEARPKSESGKSANHKQLRGLFDEGGKKK